MSNAATPTARQTILTRLVTATIFLAQANDFEAYPDQAGLPTRESLDALLAGPIPRYVYLRFAYADVPRTGPETVGCVAGAETYESLMVQIAASARQLRQTHGVLATVLDVDAETARSLTYAALPGPLLWRMHETRWCARGPLAAWLDVGIAPLVEACWARGIITTNSCQGGPSLDGTVTSEPYVALAAQEDLDGLRAALPADLFATIRQEAGRGGFVRLRIPAEHLAAITSAVQTA